MSSFSTAGFFTALILAIANYEIVEAIYYWIKNPYIFGKIIVGSAFASAIGQVFIFWTLHEFGPIKLSMITGSRKMFTVVMSIIIFKHSMTFYQVIFLTIIFISMILEFGQQLVGKKPHPKKDDKVTYIE